MFKYWFNPLGSCRPIFFPLNSRKNMSPLLVNQFTFNLIQLHQSEWSDYNDMTKGMISSCNREAKSQSHVLSNATCCSLPAEGEA